MDDKPKRPRGNPAWGNRTDGTGKSGNPEGGARQTQSEREFIELCRSATPEALAVLREIMSNPQAKDHARVTAANSIIDRAYGKPAVMIEQTLISEQKSEDLTRIAAGVLRDKAPDLLREIAAPLFNGTGEVEH
jgi:hypothetical protein